MDEITKKFSEDVAGFFEKYAFSTREALSKEMSNQEFNEIAERWQMNRSFLQVILNKSEDTIKAYKHRSNYRIPIPVAVKMRQLNLFLEGIKNN